MKRGKWAIAMSVILSGVFFAQSIAMAAMNVGDISFKVGEITVPVTSDTGESISYTVYSSYLETPETSDIAGFGEETIFEGEALLTFGLKNTGDYKIRISDGLESVVKEFSYAKGNDRESFIDEITTILVMPEGNENEIQRAVGEIDGKIIEPVNKTAVETIGVDVDKYLTYSSDVKTALCTKIASMGANRTMTELLFFEIFEEAEALAKVNFGGAALGGEAIEKLNFEFEGVRFNKETDLSKKEWIKNTVVKNKTYNSLTELEAGFKTACMLNKINIAKVTNIQSVIGGYAAVLGINNSDEYKKYLQAANPAVNTALVEDVSANKPDTIALLLVALNRAAGVNAGNTGNTNNSFGVEVGGNSPAPGGGGGFGGGAVSKNDYAIGGTSAPANENTGVVQTSTKFNDVQTGHWAYTAIDTMQKEGIISGYGDGTFLPDRTVSREEFVKMIITAFKLEDANASSHFHDVFESDWFYPYVSAAFEKGVVTGDQLGLFGVNTGITRQDATLIALRAMKVAGKTTDKIREYTAFNDESDISDYAKSAVSELYQMNKINGTDKGDFEPMRFCTRAEAAMIIYGISR